MRVIKDTGNGTKIVSLRQQRLLLRQQIVAQRQLILLQLGPQISTTDPAYPRSHTMRFFTQRPELAKRVLGQFATLVIGTSFIKSLLSALNVARILRPGSGRR